MPRTHKNKHWSEWATFEEYWYALEYKASLISTSTSLLQPSQFFTNAQWVVYRVKNPGGQGLKLFTHELCIEFCEK